jgi:hypothetical protein
VRIATEDAAPRVPQARATSLPSETKVLRAVVLDPPWISIVRAGCLALS